MEEVMNGGRGFQGGLVILVGLCLAAQSLASGVACGGLLLLGLACLALVILLDD
jgi:hypothetical protein